MSISEVLGGRRHIRFTRTVRAEIQGMTIVADVRLEAYFPADFVPERYTLGLAESKIDGAVTVALTPPMPPEYEIEILDAGADRVDFSVQPTETSFLDLVATLEATMTDDRADALKVQIALLEARPDLADSEKVTRARLLAGAAVKPLRRI